MIKVKVDGIEVEVAPGSTVLQACETAGKEIPRFCYHERLSIAGNCRMCLVEMEKSPKPVASCAMPVSDGQVIYTNTPMVKKAREGIMEFLLINHPLDCPICDQGGECDLQDQAYKYGTGNSRYELNKRSVKEKYMGPLIKTQMNRCIHCTRCVRFAEEIGGVADIGAINRGENMEITTYLEKTVDSEMSANVIDLCPVGALTSKPYAFEARPWELKKTETIDVMDAVGSNIRIDSKGWEIKRILPRLNDEINEEWISDKTRYAFDGLFHNRIDTPYIKINGKLKSTSWNEAYEFILKNVGAKKNISGLVGQLTDSETVFGFKKMFENIFNSKRIDFRQKDLTFDLSDRYNYLFNSRLSSLDNADVILLIGTNPRLEASIVNARIRKAVKLGAKVFSIGNPGDLTYKIDFIGDNLGLLDDIINNKIQISSELQKAKNPIFIIGESALTKNNSDYVVNSCKKILKKIDKLSGLNILHQSAATVGCLLLGVYTDEYDRIFESDVIYLLGADEVKISKKNNQFIIYQGSHGGENSNIADVILPSAAFTEKDGTYVNMEGRIQKSYKSSFPLDGAKEDWKIFSELTNLFGKQIDYNNFNELQNLLIKEYPVFKDLDQIPQKDFKNLIIKDLAKIDRKIKIDEIDYYKTNIVARSSPTMSECKSAKFKLNKTGTDNL
jgi:NADH-quinone oxidoreductase subunit G